MLVDIPVLAKLSSEEIDKLLLESPENKHMGKNKSTSIYSINKEAAALTLEFDKDKKLKSVSLEVLKNTRPLLTPDDGLYAGGFDLAGEKPDVDNRSDKKWENRVINGVRFGEITVETSLPSKKWVIVAAKLE